MSDDLSIALEKLRTSTQRLNTLTDAAAKIVQDVESFLDECNVGIGTQVLVHNVGDESTNEYRYSVYLTYQRCGDRFRIAVAHHDDDNSYNRPQDVHVRAWSECSRVEKLDTVVKLPELLVDLATRVDERTIKAEQAVSAIGPLLRPAAKRKGG
jgi:hypothetical protein